MWKRELLATWRTYVQASEAGDFERARRLHQAIFGAGNPFSAFHQLHGLRVGAAADNSSVLLVGLPGQKVGTYLEDFREDQLLPPGVPQSPTPVAQGNAGTLDAHTILRYYEQELRKEPSNLNRTDARPGTVIARIHNKLRNAHRDIQRVPAGSIDTGAGERFIAYLQGTIGPLLAEHQTTFAELDDLVADVRAKCRPHNAGVQ